MKWKKKKHHRSSNVGDVGTFNKNIQILLKSLVEGFNDSFILHCAVSLAGRLKVAEKLNGSFNQSYP